MKNILNHRRKTDMKRISALIMASLILICLLTSCRDNAQSKESLSSLTETTTFYWSTFLPEDIELNPDEYFFNQDMFELGVGYRKYRMVYYSVPSWLTEIIRDRNDIPPIGTVMNLNDTNRGLNGEWIETNVMDMVLFIEYYQILKEDFINAIEKAKEYRIKSWRESNEINAKYGYPPRDFGKLDHEEAEWPNPDIIYTFDNEMINAYYRRENPVVPDWLTNLHE